MINQCLSRDEGWKQFYNENIRDVEKGLLGTTDKSRLVLADAERRAFKAALANDFGKSVSILREAVNLQLKDNENSKGWYLQRIANYLYEIDTGEALVAQRSACEKNRWMFRPPGESKRPKPPIKYDIQASIMEWFSQFENPNGAIANVQDLKAKLSYDLSPPIIEQAVSDLASLIGAKGSRPEKEYGEGPDDMWLWPQHSFVIEAKNDNKESLHKKDAGQLALSLQWFKKTFPALDYPIPLMIANVSICDIKSGFPKNTRVITQEKMNKLLGSIEKLYNRIISEPLLAKNPQSLFNIQQNLKLMPDQFISNFTEELKERKK